MMQLDWNSVCHLQVSKGFLSKGLRLDRLRVGREDALDFGAPIGIVIASDLTEALRWYRKTTNSTCNPQLAALVFTVTRQPAALNPYFPITMTLSEPELADFYGLIQHITQNRNFDLRLFNGRRADITGPMSTHVTHLVAGHLAEIFFYRRDILEHLLSRPRHFWFYTTLWAFQISGGVAGGNYNPVHDCLQLILSRLYEGFYDKTPGVAPFLHEFGHMLDHFDRRGSRGVLPGMHPDDGDIYTPEARESFLKGKKLELERYLRLQEQGYTEGDPLPIGHPYVFQNNGEFVAGYFEMFFRNPHYFASLNPDLYQGFALLFKQDPRQFWTADFPQYIQENRGFYLSGQRPPRPGLTV